MSMDAHTDIENVSESTPEAGTLAPSNVSVVYSVNDRKFQVDQQTSLEFDGSGGFNPYDTASLYKKP